MGATHIHCVQDMRFVPLGINRKVVSFLAWMFVPEYVPLRGTRGWN